MKATVSNLSLRLTSITFVWLGTRSAIKAREFRLTKWISDDGNVIATVPVTEGTSPVTNLDLGDLPVERTLGVQ